MKVTPQIRQEFSANPIAQDGNILITVVFAEFQFFLIGKFTDFIFPKHEKGPNGLQAKVQWEIIDLSHSTQPHAASTAKKSPKKCFNLVISVMPGSDISTSMATSCLV